MPGAEPRGLDADRLTRLVNRDAKRAYATRFLGSLMLLARVSSNST